MPALTFTDNERNLLVEILEAHLHELPHEIHKTDSHAYRDSLKEKKKNLEELLKKVQGS